MLAYGIRKKITIPFHKQLTTSKIQRSKLSISASISATSKFPNLICQKRLLVVCTCKRCVQCWWNQTLVKKFVLRCKLGHYSNLTWRSSKKFVIRPWIRIRISSNTAAIFEFEFEIRITIFSNNIRNYLLIFGLYGNQSMV